jgi:hypothetical protein
MANQSIRDEILRLLLWLLLSMAAIPSTIPQQLLLSQFSNVGQYPIDVTLGDNPTYTVVSTNGILSVIKNSFSNTNRNKQNRDDSDPTLLWFCFNRR